MQISVLCLGHIMVTQLVYNGYDAGVISLKLTLRQVESPTNFFHGFFSLDEK